MQQLPILISFVALFVSVGGFIVSVFAYRRDSSKIKAWSRVEWLPYGVAPGKETPRLRISIANAGRRPALVLNLVMRAGRDQWFRPLRQTQLEETTLADAVSYFENFKRKSVAQLLAVKLAEGEVFDVLIHAEDSTDELLGFHLDPAPVANELLIEDVTGTLHPVKGAQRDLKQLYEHLDG